MLGIRQVRRLRPDGKKLLLREIVLKHNKWLLRIFSRDKEATGDSAEVGNGRNRNGRVKENLASSC